MNKHEPGRLIIGMGAGEDGISLLEILRILKKSWKIICVAALCGLSVSGVYLSLTPNRYEAIAQIQMARMPQDKSVLGVNVEEPAALVGRMSLPTSFNDEVLSACALENNSNLSSQLKGAINFSYPKGALSVVEIKVIRPKSDIAKACANAVYESIAEFQAQLASSISKSTQEKNVSHLAKAQRRLIQDKNLLAKFEQTKSMGSNILPAYLGLLGQIRTLEDEIERLQEASKHQDLQGAQLQSPIYVADTPAYPRKAVALIMGLFGGLLAGLAWVLGQRVILIAGHSTPV